MIMYESILNYCPYLIDFFIPGTRAHDRHCDYFFKFSLVFCKAMTCSYVFANRRVALLKLYHGDVIMICCKIIPCEA